MDILKPLEQLKERLIKYDKDDLASYDDIEIVVKIATQAKLASLDYQEYEQIIMVNLYYNWLVNYIDSPYYDESVHGDEVKSQVNFLKKWDKNAFIRFNYSDSLFNGGICSLKVKDLRQINTGLIRKIKELY